MLAAFVKSEKTCTVRWNRPPTGRFAARQSQFYPEGHEYSSEGDEQHSPLNAPSTFLPIERSPISGGHGDSSRKGDVGNFP